MKKAVSLVASFLLLFSQLGSTAEVCSAINRRSIPENVSYLYHPVSIEHERRSPLVVNLVSMIKPRYEDYSRLVEIHESIDRNSKIGKTKKYDELAKKFEKERNEIQLHFAEIAKDAEKQLQYIRFVDDNMAYFRLLMLANNRLKAEIFPVPKFTGLKSDQQLIEDAQKVVAKLEFYVEKNFKETGHKDLKSFRKYTNQHSDLMKNALDLAENHLVIAMNRPESARFWIKIAGFQNQRVTGSSQGYMAHENGYSLTHRRNTTEANLSLTPIEQYAPLSPRLKPNYGNIRANGKYSHIKPPQSVDHYGEDIWIFKEESVGQRTTWTPSDSLDSSPKSPTELGVFIPWSYRSLIAPMLRGTDWRGEPFLYPSPVPEDFNFKLGNWYASMYVELQIWGPTSLQDIQAFHFRRSPPDKEFYDLLVSKGIEVFDERQWPPKKYSGEESE